jgi:hypothetical protein
LTKALFIIAENKKCLMKTTFLTILCLFSVIWLENPMTAATENEESNQSKLVLNGNITGSVYGGTEKFDLASTFAEFSLQTTYSNGNAFLFADTRLRKGIFFGESMQELQIKELYGAFKNDKLSCTLGYQIVRKGRTDGFNPTDNLSPKNYFFLSADPDDQLLPNFMLRVSHHPVPEISIEAAIIPFYKPSVYRYDLFEMGNNVSFEEGIFPAYNFKNMSWSAAIDFEYPAFGGSLSWFRGYNPFHGFDVKNIDWSTGSPLIINAPVAYQKTSWGADFAIPVDNFIIRGEGAYNTTENEANKMYIPKTDLAYVLGLETNIAEFTVIAQYIGKFVPDFQDLVMPVFTDPMNPLAQMQYVNDVIDYENRMFNRRIFYQEKAANHALALTLNRSFGYDVWKAECTVYYNISSEEWLIRPELTVNINDGTSLSMGGNYMKGGEKTLFNYTSNVMNGVFAALKISF